MNKELNEWIDKYGVGGILWWVPQGLFEEDPGIGFNAQCLYEAVKQIGWYVNSQESFHLQKDKGDLYQLYPRWNKARDEWDAAWREYWHKRPEQPDLPRPTQEEDEIGHALWACLPKEAEDAGIYYEYFLDEAKRRLAGGLVSGISITDGLHLAGAIDALQSIPF
jgi:hypothetical protein